MADDKRKSPPRRPGASSGKAPGGATRAGGGTGGGTGGRQRGGAETASSRDATNVDEQNAAGRRPGASSTDDTPVTAAGLGGATADGDGLTAAALTASNLGDDALAEASEPILVVESLTVLTETPMQGDGGGGAAADTTAAGGPVNAQQRWLMIAERAYLRAAERGFAPGGELEDWLYAEQEVDARLAGL